MPEAVALEHRFDGWHVGRCGREINHWTKPATRLAEPLAEQRKPCHVPDARMVDGRRQRHLDAYPSLASCVLLHGLDNREHLGEALMR